ncbi:PIN domain protein [Planctomycetota bacterium]
MKNMMIYADTSVFGGCFDDEFDKASRTFFNEVKDGKYGLLLSLTTLTELNHAPENVKEVLAGIPIDSIQMIDHSEEVSELRDRYIEAEIVGESSKADAEHIAYATVAGADYVVSWNFKHIVHYEKINGYNAVNILNGYKLMAIYSPMEIIEL